MFCITCRAGGCDFSCGSTSQNSATASRPYGHPERLASTSLLSPSSPPSRSIRSFHTTADDHELYISSLQQGWDIPSTTASSAEPLGPHGHPDSICMNCCRASTTRRDSTLTCSRRCQGDLATHRLASLPPSDIWSSSLPWSMPSISGMRHEPDVLVHQLGMAADMTDDVLTAFIVMN